MQVEAWNSQTDGEINEANMRRKMEARGYTVQPYVYAPGTCFPDHTHNRSKMEGVLTGRFRISLRGTPSYSRPVTA